MRQFEVRGSSDGSDGDVKVGAVRKGLCEKKGVGDWRGWMDIECHVGIGRVAGVENKVVAGSSVIDGPAAAEHHVNLTNHQDTH